MKEPCGGCPRRVLLQGLAAAVGMSACALPTGGKPDSPPLDSQAPGCADPAPDPETWVELPFADYPALASPGGVAEVRLPEHLLDVIVVHLESGCFIAVWRICTHGACPVYWEAAAQEVWCDCHGSRFGPDGAVLEGPATRALAAFPVVRDGDSLWLDRGL